MEYINISHKRDHDSKIHAVSSEQHESHSVFNILKDAGYWCSRKSDDNIPEYIVLDFQKNVTIDYIEMTASPNGTKTFPQDIRFEGSLDGNYWMVIHVEKKLVLDSNIYRLDIPLTIIRFLKVLIISSQENQGTYYSEISRLRTGIAGISEVRANSMSLASRGPENLLADGAESFWESELKTHSAKETLFIDLGKIFHVNRIVLGSTLKGFPENFNVETSSDNNVWLPLLEEKNFKAQESKKYFWNTDIRPAQYVRIDAKSVKYQDGRYGIQIAHLEISAAPFNPFHTHNIGELTPCATIFQSGIVRLGKDGDDSPGTAVQANDRRLRDASTIFKGIIQLAEDGDTAKGLAVQASDSRLRTATDLKPGIVRLAHNRENKAGAVVQGNDSRLQEAGTDNFGIVKLCPDGKYKESAVVTGNDPRLHKATVEKYGICKLAGDGDETSGTVVQANDKRLRSATTVYNGIMEFAEDGEDSPGVAVQGNDKRLKDATTASKGIVELAEDGEDSPDVVVQGNDRRLKDATEEARGIVELAHDGEDRAGVAVQGNDRRLKDATTTSKGIVELADDGEAKSGVAVQGNDRRLKDATTTSKGIVELADDGEAKSGVAVQGNDRRLKNATTTSKGIVELAEDGEAKSGVAVQGSDKRLKDATATSKGIVELAEDGEAKSGVAVQGSDKRLKDATTTSKGIVELAEDGEEEPGVAVQGNDSRLKRASENSPGIITMARNKEAKEGCAVQSTDDRLNNARSPLPHVHDYAPLYHEFNSHTGPISITGSRQETFSQITPPSDDSAIIYAKNESVESGSIGLAGISGTSAKDTIRSYGVLGHGSHIGVRGQSAGGSGDSGKGCGVMGLSRFGAGGVFASEHDYSLIADGYGAIGRHDDSVGLAGNGDALYVNGKSVFEGKIFIHTKDESETGNFPSNMVELFEIDDAEYVMPGDILVVSSSGRSVLSRSRREYDRTAIGVVSGNPAVIINNSGKEQKVYPVALAGTVLCKIDARKTPVRPGDPIVTSDTPGSGMSGTIDAFDKIGTIIGKALDSLEDGIALVPVFITHR
jgi:hypothetical protein